MPMQSDAPRRARVYDRLEGQEQLEPARRRFAEVDTATEAFRPGSIVALAFECDELLAVQPTNSGGLALTTLCTDWSSRGASGWHTHAGDYAIESLEPSCLFRVLRDGPNIGLASIAGNGQLLCATGSGDSLGLVACSAGAWAGAGAAWERRDGGIFNTRWPEKSLAARLLHITSLPTLQMQRVEEFFGGLLHEQHAEKSAVLKRIKEVEAERDVAAREVQARQLRIEELQQQVQVLRGGGGAAQGGPQSATPTVLPRAAEMPSCAPPDVTAQLAALQRQLESLAAAGGQVQLQQERARMSICLRTIKEITDLVRQGGSTCPSSRGSPSLEEEAGTEVTATPHPAPGQESPDAPQPGYASESEAESRLVDYLGSRPEASDPLARVLDQPRGTLESEESPQRRLVRSLAEKENSLGSFGGESTREGSPEPEGLPRAASSAPSSGRKLKREPLPPPLPLADKLSQAVRQLAVGSPHTADGVAQYLATSSNLRASQQRLTGATRLRSSFLQRPPAALNDLFYS